MVVFVFFLGGGGGRLSLFGGCNCKLCTNKLLETSGIFVESSTKRFTEFTNCNLSGS